MTSSTRLSSVDIVVYMWPVSSGLILVFNIAISYQIVAKRPPSLDSQFYRPSLAASNEGRN